MLASKYFPAFFVFTSILLVGCICRFATSAATDRPLAIDTTPSAVKSLGDKDWSSASSPANGFKLGSTSMGLSLWLLAAIGIGVTAVLICCCTSPFWCPCLCGGCCGGLAGGWLARK